MFSNLNSLLALPTLIATLKGLGLQAGAVEQYSKVPITRYPENLDIQTLLSSDIESKSRNLQFWRPSCFLERPISGPDIGY